MSSVWCIYSYDCYLHRLQWLQCIGQCVYTCTRSLLIEGAGVPEEEGEDGWNSYPALVCTICIGSVIECSYTCMYMYMYIHVPCLFS